MTSTTNEARRHLELLWPDGLPEGASAYICTVSPTRVFWGEDLDELAAKALELAEKEDVYFGVNAGPRPETDPEGKRLKADEVTVMTGLVADFDIGKGWGDSAKIDEFLDSLPLPPTLRVDSGSGGRHAYWLWREEWVFESADDREDAMSIARGWAGFLEARARAFLGQPHEKVLDPVHDLPRILRLAGTFNLKGGEPRPVRIVASDDRQRYNPSDFELFSEEEVPLYPTDERQRAVAAAVLGSCELSLDPHAVGDAGLVEYFCTESLKFKKSWDRRQPQSWTQSEYDMSLMTVALNGWPQFVSLQQAIDIAMQHRREGGGLKQKTMRNGRQRPDYWIQYTLAKAVLAHTKRVKEELEDGKAKPEMVAQVRAILQAVSPGGELEPALPSTGSLESDLEAATRAEAGAKTEAALAAIIARLAANPSSATREYKLDAVRQRLDFPSLSRILQYGDGKEIVVELTTGRRLTIGSSKEARRPDAWMDLLWNTKKEGSRLGATFKGKQWLQFLNVILDLVEDRPSEDVSDRAITLGWVKSFKSTKGKDLLTIDKLLTPVKDEDGQTVDTSGFHIDSFDQGGQECRLFCFLSGELLTHVRAQLKEKVSPQQLVARLEGAGFFRRQFQKRFAGVNKNISRWAIPVSDLDGEDLPDVHPGMAFNAVDVDDTTH